MKHSDRREFGDDVAEGEDRRWSREPSLADLVEIQLSRRQALALAAATVGSTMVAAQHSALATPAQTSDGLSFGETSHGYDPQMHVPRGYRAQPVMRWGDPVAEGAQPFSPKQQTAEAQERQFGYNNDFVAFLPLAADGSRPKGTESPEELSKRGLLCVNHEYTILHMMLPGVREETATRRKTREQADLELAAHGHSVVEIERTAQGWKPVNGSRYNRRISARSTTMTLAGPAAGHARLRTSVDPTGTKVLGTLNNCAGGVTPWSTVLSGEENFNAYFSGDGPPDEAEHRARYGVSHRSVYDWGRFFDRFDVGKEPNESNRFGWVVEIDPFDRESTPHKRTALGRFKHEGATAVTSPDGRTVVYSGDDQAFNYLYRFVSAKPHDPSKKGLAASTLDDGILYVAKFSVDGTMRWLPLVFGQEPLVPAKGFHSQADVLIETRRAADLVRATPLDRPEDIEVSPITGRVYVILTNNVERTTPEPVNPRAKNKHGHILELIPPGEGAAADHAALEYRWDLLLLAGRPDRPEDGARYHAGVSASGWLTCPDNCAFDPQGRLWIATDGAPAATGVADGLYVCETAGPARALTKHFFRAPQGAEITGPCFTPDGKTLFLSVQHPADDDGSNFDNPSTRWPDFDPALPPRPSVVAITRDDGQAIGV